MEDDGGCHADRVCAGPGQPGHPAGCLLGPPLLHPALEVTVIRLGRAGSPLGRPAATTRRDSGEVAWESQPDGILRR